MSNETNNNRHDFNSSSNSQDILNNYRRNSDIDTPKSRISSASKNNEEQRFTFVHDLPEETHIKSPIISRQNTQQYNNNKLNNDNQSPLNLLDNEEQLIFNNRSRSSFHNNDDYLQQSRNASHRYDNQKSISPTSDEQHHDHSDINHPSCQFHVDKKWLDPQYHENGSIRKPNELEIEMKDPPGEIDENILDRVQGSIIGMALGDALGAHVEFRPRQYLMMNPVTDLEGGGTWGLLKGQFTDDTSMALCLANSLVARQDFIPYDQLVRYKWWHKLGYMSSTGQCFDIGAATSQSLNEFERRQKTFAKDNKIPSTLMDKLSDLELLGDFDVYCSEDGVAGNGALMRLAPVPLFFYRHKYVAVEFSGRSGEITHGDKKAYDACRFYGALIVAALRGFTKQQILAKNFYSTHQHWFGEEPLHEEVKLIAEGSFKKKGGYNEGIRGKGYIVNALEAALWAFWSDNGSFEKGALAAVNLGDDTDTTAAIYGQLAGAYYGYKELPPHWLKHVYAHNFLKTLSKWIVYTGEQWKYD